MGLFFILIGIIMMFALMRI